MLRVLRNMGLLPVVLAVGVVVLSGCGASGADGEAELTVYLSTPLSGPDSGDGRDVADGARLALADAGREAAGVSVELVVLDATAAGPPDGAGAGANARRATEDSTAIAYIGELDSGTTRTSLPITNEAGVLQVSASASAVDLTRSAPGSDQIPLELQPSGARTFGRVIPADTVQGAAAAVWMSEEEILGVEVLSGGSSYAGSLIDGLESVGDGPSIASSGGGAEAVYEASSRPVATVLGTSGNPPLFASDAQIVGLPPSSRLPAGARITSSALAPSQLPTAADWVLSEFASANDREPGRYAAYGYEAMALVLDSIARADDPLDRSSVVDAFFATTDRESILGSYSIDEVGDTTLARIGAFESSGGALRAAPQPLTVP